MTTSGAEGLDALRRAGSNAVVALGSYGLIHAGTIRFLRAARAALGGAGQVYLFALAAPGSRAAGLMREDERLRVLAALDEVDGVGLAGAPGPDFEVWADAGRGALWALSSDEDGAGAEVRDFLSARGVRFASFGVAEGCTTASLLERMSR